MPVPLLTTRTSLGKDMIIILQCWCPLKLPKIRKIITVRYRTLDPPPLLSPRFMYKNFVIRFNSA